MPLHPDSVALLDRLAAFGRQHGIPPRHEQSVEQQRHYSRLTALLRQPAQPAPLASVEDVVFDTRGGPRRARVYRPRASGVLPTLVYVHGGGYVVGGIDESEAETRRFAAAIPANVVSLSYRLAPEHPWPAAVDDIEDAVSAIAAGAVEGLTLPLALAGVSAGAGLAAAATRRFTLAPASPIDLLVLLSPWLDMTMTSPSGFIYAQGHQLERQTLMTFCEMYLPTGVADGHPELSPARHPVPEGWPRTLILAAECDPLADDAALFARRLAEAGVPHECRYAPGLLHGFHGWFAQVAAVGEHLDWLDERIRAWAGPPA
ncbi:alpha/beta hydrolase [Alsobacter sp. SYSU M60028]|uniref:Alpha/beta hydrolase n=1 Tax=Alsobacter ponti TaxID=2962936 RepID=A0ABT1LHI0_9HYPH|nr:alpha/beta hydrolase fold domain-containing protein [Alsobacter ponti]MCP8940556.1 alpha/beta hydrolase [Alsobacter ponti]